MESLEVAHQPKAYSTKQEVDVREASHRENDWDIAKTEGADEWIDGYLLLRNSLFSTFGGKWVNELEGLMNKVLGVKANALD